MRRIATFTILALLTFMSVGYPYVPAAPVYPQTGTVATEQYYRLDPVKRKADGSAAYVFCTTTVVNDCVLGVRFWRFDATGKQIDVVNVPTLSAQNVTVAGVTLFEYKTALPKVNANYKAAEMVFAAIVARDPNGKDVISDILSTTFDKKPEVGVEFGVR